MKAPTNRGRLIFSTALGNGLEIFDFTVFSFFAGFIGNAFFPAKDPFTSLLLAVGTFGAGFLARPIGAVVIGGYADRVGRRSGMMLSILLMAGGTAAIAVCPKYDQIGLIAPFIVLIGRLLQGFAAGGEVGAATTYLMESAGKDKRGYMVSWQMVSQGTAATIGAVCGFSLSKLMNPEALALWGWRIPFLLGTLIAPVGYYIRRHLPESEPAARTDHRTKIVALLTDHRSKFVTAILVLMSQSVTMYVIVFFMPSYLTRIMHFPAASGFLAATVSSVTLTAVAFIGGRLADRIPNRKPLVMCTTSLTALFCLPAFFILSHAGSLAAVIAVVFLITACLSAGLVGTLLLLMEMFPASVRATGSATAIAIAVTLFGGTAQLVVTALIAKTGDPMFAGYYVFIFNVISVAALAFYKESRCDGS
jgi:MHS family proline/betaine transporter-like MFS transporter